MIVLTQPVRAAIAAANLVRDGLGLGRIDWDLDTPTTHPVPEPLAIEQPIQTVPLHATGSTFAPLRTVRPGAALDDPLDQLPLRPSPYRDDHTAWRVRHALGITRAHVGIAGVDPQPAIAGDTRDQNPRGNP